MKKSDRISNGYKLIYKPEHHRAMKNDSYYGYVFEHIIFAEICINRKLKKNEVVHHLDGNKINNTYSNLLVLENSQHSKLHAWLLNANKNTKKINKKNYNCIVCGESLTNKRYVYCSSKCRGINMRKVKRPTKEQFELELKESSYCALGRKYGVSDNAIRKWEKNYKIEFK